MMEKGKFVALLLVALCLLWTTPRALPQVLYGQIVGTVRDSAGAAVPAAIVTVVNRGTNETRHTETSGVGGYTFPALAAGAYDLTVTKNGFQRFAAHDVVLAVDQIARVDATLRVGAVTQVVRVSAQAAHLQTDSAQVRSDLNSVSLHNLPLTVDNNYESLLITIPGISPPSNSGSYSANPSRGLEFQANGVTANANDVRIDGVSANNLWEPYVTAYVPSREAIQGVSVVTNSFNVAQGVVGGAAVNVHIKGGTNQIHGEAYENNMNSGLAAGQFNFTAPPAGQFMQKLIDNDFGATLGGPIVKDKLFYFGSFEGDRLRYGAQTLETVPTAAMRGGDFSASPTRLYNPFTGKPNGSGRARIAGNDISTLLDPTALKIQNLLLPQPNLTGITNNYFASGDFRSDRDIVDSKEDWTVTNRLRLSGRLGLLHYTMFNPPVFGNNGSPVSSVGYRTENGYGNVYDITLGGTYLAHPNLVIDGYFGVDRMNTNSVPADLNVQEGLKTLNLPGTNGPTMDYGGWPSFRVSGYSPFGNTGDSHGDVIRYYDRTYISSADANWIHGGHTVQFGGSVVRQSFNHFELASAPGAFQFSGGVTTLNAKGAPAANQFNDYAAFLLGVPSSVSKDLIPFNGGRTIAHMWQYTAYAQDRWQARPKLTLDYGVSWSYFPYATQNGRGLERYNFATNQVELCGVAGNPMNCGYDISKTGFSPAAGIAYRATPTLVVRAGAAFTYDPEPLAYIRDAIGDYPDTLAETVSAPNAFVPEGTLAAGIPAITVPNISSGFVTLPRNFQVTSLAPNYKRDYIESWNFSLQKQVGLGWFIQAGYVGDQQVDVPGLLNLNVGQVGGGQASSPYFARNGSAALRLETAVNHTHYDSLQASLSHQFGQGYQLHVAYTWSKVLGDCCNNLADGGPDIQLPQYFLLNYGLEPWDRPQDFVVSWVAQSPFGNGKRWLNNGWEARLAGGWQMNGIFSAFSGTPFTVTGPSNTLNAPGNTQRANLIGTGRVAMLGGVGPGQHYFDPSRFAPVPSGTFAFGSAGFDILRGPGQANIDFSLFRSFRVSERLALQFRGEALNLTNTPHFGNPEGSVTSGSFAQITRLGSIGREGIDQRIFRLGLYLTF